MASKEEEIAEIKRLREIEEIKRLRAKNEGLAREAVTDPHSSTEAAVAGAAQGLGQNFLDELYGARKGVQDVLPIVGDHSVSELGDRYRHHRDEARKYYDDIQEGHPVAFGAGELVGGGASAFVPGMQFSKAGPVGAAAIAGGLQGLGASNKDSALGNVEDAAKGAGAGALLSKILGKLVPSAEGVRHYANEKAVKASGAMTKEFRALEKNGLLDKQGEFLLKNKIVTPLASLEDVAERAAAKKATAGETIGAIIDGTDQLRERAVSRVREIVGSGGAPATKEQLAHVKAFEDGINAEFGYNFNNVADKIEAIIGRDDKIAASKFHREKLQTLADEFRRIGEDGPGTLREGLRNKTEHRRLLKDVDNLGEDYKQEVYDLISGELDRAVENFERLETGVQKLLATNPIDDLVARSGVDPRALPAAPGPLAEPMAQMPAPPIGLQAEAGAKLDAFKQANRDYAAAATAEAIADKRLGGVRSNRDFGLTTAIAANAGLLAGGPGAAAAMGAANNFFRKYGSSLQATGADKIAKMLESGAELPVLGRHGPALEAAAGRGLRNLLITNIVIGKTDPRHKGFLDKLNDGLGGKVSLTDPADLDEARFAIRSSKDMNSIEKATLLSEINETGALSIDFGKPRPAEPISVPAAPAPSIDGLIGTLKGIVGPS